MVNDQPLVSPHALEEMMDTVGLGTGLVGLVVFRQLLLESIKNIRIS